jgi:hypothetical protein
MVLCISKSKIGSPSEWYLYKVTTDFQGGVIIKVKLGMSSDRNCSSVLR